MAAIAVRVGDPLDDVLDAVDGHRADRLARLGEQRGQPAGQRQAPDGREVGVGRPGEVEAVGRRLRRRALVGEHAAGALVDDLQPAEHADEVARACRRRR